MGTRWASRLAGHAAGNTFFFGFRNKEQRTQKKNKNKKQTPFPAFFFVCVRAQLFSLFFFSWNE
jgi:hypothetical protein